MTRRLLVCNWRDRLNPDAGGAEVNIHAVCGRLVRRGYDVTLLCSRYDRSQTPEEHLDGIRVLRRGNRWTFNLTVPRVLTTELRRESFDLVIDEITKIPFYTPLYARAPVIARVHHVHGTSVRDDFGLLTTAYVVATEGCIPAAYRGTPFVAVSEGTKADLVRLGVKPDSISVIYNGLDHGVYTPATDGGGREPLVLFVGRLRKYKGAGELLEAFANVAERLPDARLSIVGKGDQEAVLRERTRTLGLDGRVTFHGFVDGAAKVELMRRACVLVNPSRKEGWGLTVLEANACGTPAIGARGTGLSEAIRHGLTGYLYEPGNVAELADRIAQLLKRDAAWSDMVREAKAWAARFSWDEVVAQHEALFDRVLTGEFAAEALHS